MSAAHAAIVLAAGGSTRLGRPKQLLRSDGESLVARVVRLVADTHPCRLVVMLGAYHDAVAAELAPSPHACVELHDVPGWHEGLSASLVAASRALQSHRGPVLVTGIDQPALNALHLRALLDGSRSVRSGCAAAMYGERPGAPTVLSHTLFAQAVTLSGDRGFGALLAALPEDELFRLQAPSLAQDIDTADDVQQALADGLLDRGS
ncbi:nucleotidyltransferase family protein [Luteimonas sp. XNQY3]|nr:nucleotidyltransferase family protein [Luteimonas sp. XNQY3]MCD9006068.1 nucleotidyltransferase family protein [Luteimonas sp. XNQY3]